MGCSNGYTPAMNTPELALASRFASELLSGIMAESGSNPDSEKEAPSTSPFLREETGRTARPCILIVEDHTPDLMLIREAIGGAQIEADIQIARDGQQATDYIDAADRDAESPVPTLIVLDINLPKKHGSEVLAHLRKSVRCRGAKVLVVSTSDAAVDRERMSALGADGYFRKPSEFSAFMKLGDVVRELIR